MGLLDNLQSSQRTAEVIRPLEEQEGREGTAVFPKLAQSQQPRSVTMLFCSVAAFENANLFQYSDWIRTQFKNANLLASLLFTPGFIPEKY